MQTDNEKWVSKDDSDRFYDKLTESFDSSGLILLFDVRETMLDLYLFFKQVTQRGGFHQVTKERRWAEVASAVQLKGSNPNVCNQLQKLYANFLYQIEQICCYRTPGKPASAPGQPFSTGSSAALKRNASDTVSPASENIDNSPMRKKMCNGDYSSLVIGSRTADKNMSPPTFLRGKNMKKNGHPLRIRTAYQFFLKMECTRLRKTLGESIDGQNVRNMALDAWRLLSESERHPYLEESRKDKERFIQEMNAYREWQRDTQETEAGKKAGSNKEFKTDNDYCVILQPETESFFLSDQSTAHYDIKMAKVPPLNDPILEIAVDDYCGPPDISI